MKVVTPAQLVAHVRHFQKRGIYEKLKAATESKIVEWRWATGPMGLQRTPFDDIVCGFKRDRWTKTAIKSGYIHGLDTNGQILCARGAELGVPAYEQFALYEDGGYYWICFDPKGKLLAIDWYWMDGERWLGELSLHANGITETLNHWEDGRFLGYESRQWRQGDIDELDVAESAKLDRNNYYGGDRRWYQYDANGELEKVLEAWPKATIDEARVKYLRLPKGLNLKSLLEEAEELLLHEIPKSVESAKLNEPIVALLVQYTGVDTDPDGFAPPVLVIPESVRARILAETSDAGIIWSGPEMEMQKGVRQINCESPLINEKLHWVFQLTIVKPSVAKYGPVRKMFQQLCRRLNETDWKKSLKLSDDFVVVPFDPHGEIDLKTDLRACVPQKRLELLLKRGYLPRMKIK